MPYRILTVLILLLPALSTRVGAQATYDPPFAHSTGADLLPYCLQTDVVVSRLRCDYYVQGVADLVSIPRGGRPMACIPKGQTRTQLMAIAVDFLGKVKIDRLETESAAKLLLQAYSKEFPCPKGLGKVNLPKTGKTGMSEGMKAALAKRLQGANLEAAKKKEEPEAAPESKPAEEPETSSTPL